MEKKFETPELEIIRFEDVDMITTSGGSDPDAGKVSCNDDDWG